MTFKETFPTEAALVTAVDDALGAVVAQVQTVAGPLEANYKKSQRYSSSAVVCGVVGILLTFAVLSKELWMSVSGVYLVVPPLISATGLLCLAGAVYCWKQSRKLSNNFVSVAHNEIYLAALRILGLDDAQRILYTLGGADKTRQVDQAAIGFISEYLTSPERTALLALIDHSELVTESRNMAMMGDMVSFTVNGKQVFVSELDLRNETGSGKNRKVKKIFHGYFVSCDLPVLRSGKTFVSTDGDRNGFGHRTFWNTRVTDAGLSDVILEWNEFENLLHVASTDQIEARVVLTPDVMHRLYDWWQGEKGNIRLSFIASRLYILFPSREVTLAASVKTISPEAIRNELLVITKPLVPILHLLEVV